MHAYACAHAYALSPCMHRRPVYCTARPVCEPHNNVGACNPGLRFANVRIQLVSYRPHKEQARRKFSRAHNTQPVFICALSPIGGAGRPYRVSSPTEYTRIVSGKVQKATTTAPSPLTLPRDRFDGADLWKHPLHCVTASYTSTCVTRRSNGTPSLPRLPPNTVSISPNPRARDIF